MTGSIGIFLKILLLGLLVVGMYLMLKVIREYGPLQKLREKVEDLDRQRDCTVITLRMKMRRMRWSVNGANNLAKALYDSPCPLEDSYKEYSRRDTYRMYDVERSVEIAANKLATNSTRMVGYNAN